MSFTEDYLALEAKRQKKKKKTYEELADSFYSTTKLEMNEIAPLYVNKTAPLYAEEDIAPVTTTKSKKKEDKKLDFFQKGAFEDGYDVGDITKAILGTTADAGVGIVKGASRLVEGIADAGYYASAKLADKMSGKEFGDRLRAKAQENVVDDTFSGIDNYLNKYSVLGKTSDAAAEGIGQVAAVILTGGAAGAAGLGATGATLATTGVMGVSSIGSGMSEAYASGATDKEAETYGIIKGIVDAGSELIFGGLGKTVKALGISKGLYSLDDVFAKKLGDKIANQTAKNFVEYGVKASTEGVEEVLAGLGSAVGKKLTYMSDKELKALIEDENLLEQFVVGTVTSGIAQSGIVPGMKSGSLVEANKEGRDFVSGLSGNEQKVVEKEYQNRLAEEEKNGKLTNKQKNDIYDKVVSAMEKGRISTSTIEEVLGGEGYTAFKSEYDAFFESDNYKAYKDTLTSEAEQIKQIEAQMKELESAQNTLGNAKKYEALQSQIEEIKNSAKKAELEAQLDSEAGRIAAIRDQLRSNVSEMVKGDRLSESYRELARSHEKYTADLTKYDAKQQETIKKAVESGILNNTNRAHEFVDLIAKITADKGVPFDFTNNKRLKESGFAVGDKTVNGYVTKDGVTLNIDSAKSLNSVVGHEITHVLEGTELYTALQSAVVEYAKTKGDYQGRYDSLADLYKGVEGADVNAELTADLVGDYLFTDEDFVRNLSAQHRNVFQKIYDEIKYLCKVATAGSKEARELEKVKRAFEKAYQESGKTEGTKYSLSDSDGKQLTKEQSEFFKDSKMRDENGNLLKVYHGSPNKFTTFRQGTAEGWGTGIYFTDNRAEAENYGENIVEAYLNITNPFNADTMSYYDIGAENTKAYRDYDMEVWKRAYDEYDTYEEYKADGQGADMYDIYANEVEVFNKILRELGYDGIIADGSNSIEGLEIVAFKENQAKLTTNEKPTADPDIRFSLSDSDGNPIDSARISQDEFDTRYSLSHNPEIAKGQSDYLLKHKAYVTDDELAAAQRVTNAMVDVMMKYSSILPEDKIGKVLTKNGSYDRSVENTTICVRTLAYNEFVDKVQEEIGRPLSQMESFLVSQKLYDIATDPQCLYCYVSLDRKAFNDMLLRYMQDRDTVISKYNKSDKSPEAVSALYEEFRNGRKDTKPMRTRFDNWLNYVDNGTPLLSLADIATEDRQRAIKANGGNLAAQLADARLYAQNASWSKIQKNYVAYRDEILKLGDRVVKNLNEHYGLRWYSFSDYSAAFIVENMQQITDASIRGLKGLAYTKDTDFVEIFAPSGMNINVSVFVNRDENGNFFIDEKQSANFQRAQELRETYPNVGIVATVTDDDALRWAASQEWSDVIIPFHIVRTGTDVAEYYKWLNYTAESADTIGNADMWNAYLDSLNLKSEGARKKVSKNIYPNEHKNNKDTYLNLCESRGLTPRFARFAGEDWYMKLVNETRLSADASSPLKPVYNEDAAKASFQKFVEKGGYEGGWYKKAIDVNAEAKAVAADVLAGKKANEVSYGRQDKYSPEDLIASRKTNRKHGQMSLSRADEQVAPVGDFNIYGKDMKLDNGLSPLNKFKYQEEVAPVANTDSNAQPVSNADSNTTERVEDMFPDNGEPVVDDRERFESLTDADMPPEREAPYTESGAVEVEDPFEERDWYSVGNQKVKAYMYENPEVKPFFQEQAAVLLDELANTTKGERWYSDELYYQTGGEKGFGGTKRTTSDSIAEMRDSWGMSYEDIEKGLEAIVKDNGAENIAAAKKIEFMLNDRLMNGYTSFVRWEPTMDRFGGVPANQEYIKLLEEKQITAYSKEAFDALMANADQYAPTEDIAPVAKAPKSAASKAEEVPAYETKTGQTAMFEEPEAKEKITRSELHNGIVDNIKARFKEKGYDFDKVLKNANNLSTFSTVDNTPQRVMEKALGYKEGQILADLTVNKVAQNETEGIKWLNSFTDNKNGLLKQLSNQYHIKPGSKESAAAQMYAEGFYVAENNDIISYGDAELAADFPNAQVQANIKALARDPRIRRIYDDTLAMINESRTRNAYPEIQRLDNYFLHFRAMDDTFSKLGLPFNPNDIRAKDLPTDLNGVTADLKPGQPYFASAMHRTGKRTSFDLLGGLERYLTSAKNQIYHIDDIQTLRALRNNIADTYGQANGLESLDMLSEEEAQERIEKVYSSHLSTFAKFLNEEANILAGKTALIDRGLEGIIGRRGITFLNTLNRQVGSNMVGYNISSSLTNFLPVVQTFAKTNKFDFVKAFAQTVANKTGSVFGRSDGFAENSPVMIRRKGADRFHRTLWQKASDPGYAIMGAVDSISTELIARTKYNELVRKGMDSQTAHYETDKWVSRLMGDRSIGQMPQIYNSKMLGLVTKFQLEVRNQLDSQFYDTIQETKVSNEHIENALARNAKTAAKVASTFVQLAVAQHLFGKAFESVAGYNPAFDIIEVLLTACGFDDEEDSEDTALDNIEQGFLALLEDLPYASTFMDGGRIPISAALPIGELVKGEDEWGNEKSRWQTLGEVAPYYALPGGYGQIKKTKQGLNMFSDEHPIAGSYTDSGNLRFPVEDTFKNRVQAGIFGQWANENARDYFDNDRSPLKEKQIQEFIDVDIPIRDYWEYREGLSGLSKLGEKADYIADLDLPIAKKNLLINNIADRKEDIDLTGYENFGSFEEFDFAVNNPQKYDIAEKVGGYNAYMKYQEGMKDMKLPEKAEYIAGLNLTDEQKNALINGETDRKEPIDLTGYDPSVFDSFEDFEVAKDNPAVAKVIGYGDYANYMEVIGDFDAKDANGDTVNGLKKERVSNYIFNDLDIDYGAKCILYRSMYKSKEDKANYNPEIIDYLNSRDDVTYEEMVDILERLDMTVSSDGYIYW